MTSVLLKTGEDRLKPETVARLRSARFSLPHNQFEKKKWQGFAALSVFEIAEEQL